MARIIINRTTEFSNLIRSIEIYLGNEKIGTIRDGESKEFEVEAGEYELRAKIDWCGSNKINFTIGENEVLRYNLSGTNPFFGLYYITFGKDRYLRLKPIK